jgi:RimJ/RimL family protein N-acetyltransferase
MPEFALESARLRLVLDSTDAVLARIEALSPEDRAEVSPEWVARMRAATPSPWTHGFTLVERATGEAVGSGGYYGPPDAEMMVEVAYGVAPEYRGRGYAKEACAALVAYARDAGACTIRAHTRPDNGASARVLTSCGFVQIGELVDPVDGLVCRWEIPADEGAP